MSMSNRRRIDLVYANIHDTYIRPADRKQLHWRDIHTKPFNYAYWRSQNGGYYQMQFALRESRIAPTPIQQAVLDAEQDTHSYDTWRVELSPAVHAVIKTDYDEYDDWGDDAEFYENICRAKTHPAGSSCVYYTQQQLREMGYHFRTDGYLHIPYDNPGSIRAYHSKRGMARHDADIMGRNWLRYQLDLALREDTDASYYIVTVTIYVNDEPLGRDSLGGIFSEDSEDILDAVIEHEMVENALVESATILNDRIGTAPAMLKELAPLL